jgi:ABC-type polysaccharide/polyol phosphate export permease
MVCIFVSHPFELQKIISIHNILATFPTPREATIFFDENTTASRANQTLRQILEKNPLLKNLDMFKEGLTTQSYRYANWSFSQSSNASFP